MTTASTTLKISVAAVDKTVIGKVAQALAAASPGAPAWSGAEIGVGSLNSSVHYWGEPAAGSPVEHGRPPFHAPNGVSDAYNILDWGGKAHWDRTRGEWWFSGGPTGNQDPASPTVVRYRPADDTFCHWQGESSGVGGIWPPYGHAHSFDACDLDVAGRKLYRHLKPKDGQLPYNYHIGVFDIDTCKSEVVDGDQSFADYFPTLSFMPGSRVLHVIYSGAGYNSIRRLNVDSRTWLADLKGPDGDRGASVYFNGKIYATTGAAKNFYAILPDGTIENKAATPVAMDGSYSATHAILCPLGDHIYAFCGNGDIWRYSPAADSWGGAAYHSIPWFWPHDTYQSG